MRHTTSWVLLALVGIVCASPARSASTDPCAYVNPAEAASALGSGSLHATSNVTWTGPPVTVPSCSCGGTGGPVLLVQAMSDSDVAVTQKARKIVAEMMCNSTPAACESLRRSAQATTVRQLISADRVQRGVKLVIGIGEQATYYQGAISAISGHMWIHIVILNGQLPELELNAEKLARIAIRRVRDAQ